MSRKKHPKQNSPKADKEEEPPAVVWVYQKYRPDHNIKVVKILRQMGWKVIYSSTTSETINKIKTTKNVRCIVTDMKRVEQPGDVYLFNPNAGIDLLKRLQQTNVYAQIIVHSLSTREDTKKIEECLSNGATLLVPSRAALIDFMRHLFFIGKEPIVDHDLKLDWKNRAIKCQQKRAFVTFSIDPCSHVYKELQEHIESYNMSGVDKRLKIVCIDKIENDELHYKYCLRRSQLHDCKEIKLLFNESFEDINTTLLEGISLTYEKLQSAYILRGINFTTYPIRAYQKIIDKTETESFTTLIVFEVAVGTILSAKSDTLLHPHTVLHSYDSVVLENDTISMEGLSNASYMIYHPFQAKPMYLISYEVITLSPMSLVTENRIDKDKIQINQFGVPEIRWSELFVDERKGLLGSGAFGHVYRGKWRGVIVAVKKLNIVTNEQIDTFKQEAAIMHKLGNHPNIVRLCGICLSPTCIVSTFYPKGSVYDLLIAKNISVDWKQIVKIAADAATGVYHLHCESVIHRDIASRNVLVDNLWHGVVCDFGLATIVKGDYVRSKGPSPAKYMAPESIKQGKFSPQSDAYSFGVFLWECISKTTPYPDMEIFEVQYKVVFEDLRPEIPENCHPLFKELMISCWESNPSSRPDFKTISAKLLRLATELEVAEEDPSLNDSSEDAVSKPLLSENDGEYVEEEEM